MKWRHCISATRHLCYKIQKRCQRWCKM